MKINNEREAKIFMLGQMKGLNDVRLRFWGFGYDNDDTANQLRKYTCAEIGELSHTLQIDKILFDHFSDVQSFIKDLSKDVDE